jgi:hypothetical protein
VNTYYVSRACPRSISVSYYRIYDPKEVNPSWEVSISINFGVMEYWSVGVTVNGS